MTSDRKNDDRLAYQRLEKNLVEREVKLPFFRSNIERNKCQQISLSGREALTAIADRNELTVTGRFQSELFDGVFSEESLMSRSETDMDCMQVLRKLHPSFYCKVDPEISTGRKHRSTKTAAELWRKSLKSMAIILRTSKTFADVARDYSFWSERYYQVCVALLPSDVPLTPYKMKLMLFPELVASGFLPSPWYHMTEGLEKSNHRSQKDFQTRTMRGGVNLWNKDPM